MGHETGTTINDIVVTAVAGALRRYLRSRDSPVEELTASVPFNLRPLDQPLPSELGNRFGLVLLRLPLGIGVSPPAPARGAPPDGGDQALTGRGPSPMVSSTRSGGRRWRSSSACSTRSRPAPAQW